MAYSPENEALIALSNKINEARRMANAIPETSEEDHVSGDLEAALLRSLTALTKSSDSAEDLLAFMLTSGQSTESALRMILVNLD